MVIAAQLEKFEGAVCEKVFNEKRSGMDSGGPELKCCLEYLREGTCSWLQRSTGWRARLHRYFTAQCSVATL
jgi:hypothetical protein